MQSTNKKLRLSSLVVQWVKDPMLSLQELGLLLGFDPWPGNLHMLWMQKKKKASHETWKEFLGLANFAPLSILGLHHIVHINITSTALLIGNTV